MTDQNVIDPGDLYSIFFKLKLSAFSAIYQKILILNLQDLG